MYQHGITRVTPVTLEVTYSFTLQLSCSNNCINIKMGHNILKLSGSSKYGMLYVNKVRFLLTHYIFVPWILTVNTDYFRTQHQLIAVCSGAAPCFF